MTEQEWLTCEDVGEMLPCLLNEHSANRRPAGRRKLRLFGCASSRLFCETTTDPRSLAAIEYIERLTDGEADGARMAEVQEAASQAIRTVECRPVPDGIKRTEMPGLLAAQAAFHLVNKRANWCAHAVFKTSAGIGDTLRHHFNDTSRDPKWIDLLQTLCHLLRDIAGNPFRPTSLNRAWLTTDVVALARGIYDERAFDRMPILADALQDAGCDNEDVLNHCRDAEQVHVRGCWVVDLVLGKK